MPVHHVNRLLGIAIVMLAVCFSLQAQKATSPSWTHLHSWSGSSFAENKIGYKSYVITKTTIPQFTQLIFSWNAARPKNGGTFTFWGRVRTAKTGEWYEWHRMVDWGDGIQKTHLSIHPNKTSYHYVRLEAPTGQPVDGFAIKVDLNNGAQLSDINRIFISTSDMNKFVTESVNRDLSSLPSVLVKKVPLLSQMKIESEDAPRLCAPASIAMVSGHFNKGPLQALDCAKGVYDTGLRGYGSWQFNVACAYERAGKHINIMVRRLPSFKELHAYLKRGVPVIVSINGAIKTMPDDTVYGYMNGHVLVVVGWDSEKKEVICNDPGFSKQHLVRHAYPAADFIRAWEKSRRLAYVPEPKR